MINSATLVLRRTTDLVYRFRSKPRAASAAFARSKIKSPPHSKRTSTAILVRKLAQPVLKRQNSLVF